MQLIWMSGPTGRIMTLAITTRGMLGALLVLAALLVGLGVAFHSVGLRIAIELSPGLLPHFGGITTLEEARRADEAWRARLARIEDGYRARLAQFEERLAAAHRALAALESTKQSFVRSLGPRASEAVPRAPAATNAFGQGGPVLPAIAPADASGSVEVRLDGAARQLSGFEELLFTARTQWRDEFRRLGQLPLSTPLRGEFSITSGFGVRIDPITQALSAHEGVDLVSAHGAPVVATAPGTVVRSEWLGAFGQTVEIRHADGYLTRYAHLSRRNVSAGHRVERGDEIGALGSSGRSTGPHLHYEIEHRGRPIDPMSLIAPPYWRD